MGTDTPAAHAGETIVYDHVFTESSPKVSLTIEQSQGENCRRFAGAIASQLKFTGKIGDMVTCVASFMAKSQATSTAITPAFSTLEAFNWAELSVKIGGSVVGEVQDFELTYQNGLSLIHAINGSVDPAYAAISGGSEVTGKISLFLDATSLTELTDYIAHTNRSLEIIATGVTAIGSTSHNVLDISLPVVSYTSGVTKITDQHNLLELEFTARYDTVTSKLIAITLTNLMATI